MVGKRLRFGIVIRGGRNGKPGFHRIALIIRNGNVAYRHSAVVSQGNGEGNAVSGIDKGLVYNGGHRKLGIPAVHGDFFAFYRFIMAAAAGGKGCLGCTRHGFGGLNGFGNRPAGARFERYPGSYAVRHGRIGDAKAGNVGGARIFQAICQLYRIAGVDGGFADGAGKGQRNLFLLTRYLERNTFGTAVVIGGPIHHHIGIGGIQIAAGYATGNGKSIGISRR